MWLSERGEVYRRRRVAAGDATAMAIWFMWLLSPGKSIWLSAFVVRGSPDVQSSRVSVCTLSQYEGKFL